MLSAGEIQDPDRSFPFASQAVQNSTLQFLLTEKLSTGIISHLIKISFLRLKDLEQSGVRSLKPGSWYLVSRCSLQAFSWNRNEEPATGNG